MAERPHQKGKGFLVRWRTIALVLLGLIVLDIGLYFVVLRPRLSMSGDTETRLADAREELGVLRAELATLKGTASKFSCAKAEIDDFFNNVLSVKEARLVAIFRELRDIAEEKHVDLGKIVAKNRPIGLGDLVEVGLAFSFEGNYTTLREFIDEVEQSPNLLLVQGVQLSGERSRTGKLKLQIQLLTYFQAPNYERFQSIMERRGAAEGAASPEPAGGS